MAPPRPPAATFTPKERRVLKLYGVEVALIGAVLAGVAAPGSGRWMAVVFAAALLPVPPLVLWAYRRLRPAR